MVKPMTGNFFVAYFQYQGFVGCVCMLNGWFSSNDEVYADNYIYFRFKLQGRSEKWELYLYGDMTIKVAVIVWKCCPGVCLRFGSSPNLATDHTFFDLCRLLSVAWV